MDLAVTRIDAHTKNLTKLSWDGNAWNFWIGIGPVDRHNGGANKPSMVPAGGHVAGAPERRVQGAGAPQDKAGDGGAAAPQDKPLL